MTHSRIALIGTVALAFTLSAACAREDILTAASRGTVDAEIVRVERALQTLEAGGLPDGLRPLVRAHERGVENARRATDSSSKIWHLREPYIGVEAIQYLLAHSQAGDDLALFESLWNAERPEFAAPPAPTSGSQLQQALAAAARNRAGKLFRASLPYGRTSSPGDGLYYLAEAKGNLRFGKFIAALAAESAKERPLRASAIRNALRRVETQTLAAFERDPSGKTTILVSARLKEARELLDGGHLEAAALTLLDARLELSRREGGKREPAPAALEPPHDSIPALFDTIATKDPQSGAHVGRDVIPLYESLLFETAHPATPAAPVKVTLARWPYT